MSDKRKVVVVTGDVTIDWNLAHTPRWQRRTVRWSYEDCTRPCCQPGGVVLLADLIEAVAKQLPASTGEAVEVRKVRVPRARLRPDDDRFHHSYARWSLVKKTVDPKDDSMVWRVTEFLGLDRCPALKAHPSRGWLLVDKDTPDADLIVLDDAGLGFRKCKQLWPQSVLRKRQRPWILLKMAVPVATGPLWTWLHKYCSRRLVVVMSVNDLRRTVVLVSQQLSWERTAQDLFWELVHNPEVNALSQCAHVVISFGPAGAVLISRQDSKDEAARDRATHECSVFFDPKTIEGMWEQQYPGHMIGYNTCLTAAIARELMLPPKQRNIHRGIRSGLSAVRALHLEGYRNTVKCDDAEDAARRARLEFPTKRIAAKIAEGASEFVQASVKDPARLLHRSRTAPWSILEDLYTDSLEKVAAEIVELGPEDALKDVPLGQFGALLTVDREEIESLRSIRTLVREYSQQQRPASPLSIAVFGAPGSGKSFGITEVAKSLLPGEIEKLTFNLSQFDVVDDLLDAFHQVRDVSLSGKLPLVFWDEFDSEFGQKPLGWLRHFLAPMQDGEFQQGQITHSIGRAIFAFAGGTSWTVQEFERSGDDDFVQAKGPDFVSRLKGYVNIKGPNRQTKVRPVAPDQQGEAAGRPAPEPQPESTPWPAAQTEASPSGDPYYIIRRAVLLRSVLQRNAAHLFAKQGGKGRLHIDPGVLRAFLKVGRYKHGVRSMESIVAMSVLAGKATYERSSLPSEAQLDLHVDGKEFLALVQRLELEGELLEQVAERAHEVYCEKRRARGETTDALKPWNELASHYKEQNRDRVRDIPVRLDSVGYVMMPARGSEPPSDFPGPHLEWLAAVEHTRWMEAKLDAGWQYGLETDKAKKLNSYLVAWNQLTPDQRGFNLELVQDIPLIADRAGYTIVKLRNVAARSAEGIGSVNTVLRVGVTGHRFLAQVDTIIAAVDQVLDQIQESFPERQLVVISPLAEGADRIAARRVLERTGARLLVPLPLQEADYMRDFQTDESKQEFLRLKQLAEQVILLETQGSREDAYEAVGRYVLEYCDVLLAIWDGKEAQGQGGTADIVAKARRRGKPLAWVHAGNRKPGTIEPTTLGPDQGKVTVEGFPAQSEGQ